MRDSYALPAQSVTRNAFGSLVLPGTVVVALSSDYLKIRPEFSLRFWAASIH
ncbi:hypothetical protein [Photobacterium salinisoli]|uniref:hypothetical protein n=1 Tax=Photobacterium salinisoli TaxID=1616783 RepID=UPI0013C41B79|nr:hypothetical protein [Photobacterium salinisoli]